MPTFICDCCDEVTAVCHHLDARIAYLEHIAFSLERIQKAGIFSNVPGWDKHIGDLLSCDHPANMVTPDGNLCMVCRNRIEVSK